MANVTDTYFTNTDPLAAIVLHDTWTKGAPHAAFARLREQAPVAWIDEPDGRGYWAILRYADIVDLSRRYDDFTSREGIRLEEMSPEEAEARRTMMEMDPPEHTRLRRMVNKVFTRRVVEEYNQQIRALAVEVVEEAIVNDEFDFVEAVARPLPMRMLGRLLGTPDEDGQYLVALGDALIGNTDPEFTEHVVDMVDTDDYHMMPFRSPAAKEIFDYARVQAEERRRCPKDDIITKLLEPSKTDGEPITELEFMNFFTLMVAAGNDTTRYTMAGSIKALIEYPEAFAHLRDLPDDDPAWDTAVEELLRWTTVTTHFRRTATHDVELHGETIRQGDKVLLYFISGDFDEAQFDDPYRLDLTRTPNDHLAFGRGGPHRCLGEWLARLELRVLMQEWLRRVEVTEQAGPEEYFRSNFIAGIKHLPVRVTLR